MPADFGEGKLEALLEYAGSPALTDDEKLVGEYAAVLSTSPAEVSDDLWRRLNERFTRAQLTELAAEIAWENQRARLNQALRVRPAGFSDGAYCLGQKHPGSVLVCSSSTTRPPRMT